MARTANRPPRRPTRRGFLGPGGGSTIHVEAPTEFRGTTSQVCGLWPFAVGSTTPMVGTPFGTHLHTGATVCFDPVSWFQRTSLIATPNLFVLGAPALGKSAAVRRIVLGAVARGETPLILGDTKGEYVALVRALGGQVISVATGRDRINPLDVGDWRRVTERVGRKEAQAVRASVIDRRLQIVQSLAGLVRGEPVSADETTVLAAAVALLTDREGDEQPILADLYALIADPPQELRAATVYADPAEEAHFRARLQRTFLAILSGRLGDMLNGPSTVRIDPGATAVCIDLEGVDVNDTLRTAAALITSWSVGFGAINTAHYLADAGLAPARVFVSIVDEMWRFMRVAKGQVDLLDGLTRLSRFYGSGAIFISHSTADLQALATEEDRMKAMGFADRCSVLLIAASTPAELEAISRIRPLSEAERREVGSWYAPGSWEGTDTVRTGRGKFLLKVSERAGIPIQLVLTPDEIRLGNTDARWNG